MMAGRFCCREVIPFMAMAAMEGVNVGLNTLFKAATLKGMSYHVFMVYDYAIAALLLSPAPFISSRSTVLPPLNSRIISKILLLGLIGSTAQMMGFKGISLSSPTLASAIGNLTPAFTFILAVLFRMEKISTKRRSSQAKILGTAVSISGAFVVTLYKGRPLHFALMPSSPSLLSPAPPVHSNWVLGGTFLMVEYLLVPLWYIVQTQIMKEYPAELTVVFFYDLCVCFNSVIIGLITEHDLRAWRVSGIGLASVVCSGLFGSCLINFVHTRALRLKGPFYVAMFKPLSIAIAFGMGVTLLGDTLHLGSLIGAMIISIGFYTVMWGKFKEEMVEVGSLATSPNESLPSQKTPLLRNNKDEV